MREKSSLSRKTPLMASNEALRERNDQDLSVGSRDRSPTMSQASNIIRKKYSQMRSHTTRDQEEPHHPYAPNTYINSSPRRENDTSDSKSLTVAQLQNEKPLRRSPERNT